MAITIYRSTDTSAPILTGQVGSSINLLDACLVNGYPNGVKAGLGQTKPYSGTNLAVYRMPAGTSQTYLAVDATLATAIARVRGFITMSGAWASAMTGSALAAIGTRPFPLETQYAGGERIALSATADAVARPWVLISNGNIFYLWVDSASDGGVAGGSARMFAFGDIDKYNPLDTNPCILIGIDTGGYSKIGQFSDLGVALAGHYMAQRQDGWSYSVAVGKIPISGWHSAAAFGQSSGALPAYPDPIVGGLILSPIAITEVYTTGTILRGRLPGIQAPCCQFPFNTGDTFTGTVGDINGRTFEAFRHSTYTTGWLTGGFMFETSDTWDDVNFK